MFKNAFIFALMYGAAKLIEKLINMGVKHSKLTANTWDDAIFNALDVFVNGFISIFFKSKK